MTATKIFQRGWPYLLLVTLLLIAFPNIAGLAVVILADDSGFNYDYFDRARSASLIYHLWSFLLLVLFPYGLMYLYYNPLKKTNFLIHLPVFYFLLVLMGVIVPSGSVVEFFKFKAYPAVLVVYILMTSILCPLCYVALRSLTANIKIEGNGALWPFILLIGVLLILFPVILLVIVKALGLSKSNFVSNYFGNDWESFFRGMWISLVPAFFLLVMFPFIVLFLRTHLQQANIYFKFMVFFGLLILMGLALHLSSFLYLFWNGNYIDAGIIALFLTITLCPVCIIALNRIVKNRRLTAKS